MSRVSWLDSAKQWARSIGYLDDLILVPLGILLAVRLVPAEIMTEHRATAAVAGDRPVSRIAAAGPAYRVAAAHIDHCGIGDW